MLIVEGIIQMDMDIPSREAFEKGLDSELEGFKRDAMEAYDLLNQTMKN